MSNRRDFLLSGATGFGGLALAIYLAVTLIGHVGYGFTLGAVFDYFSNRPDTLV